MLQGPFFAPSDIKYAVILCHGYGSNGDDLAGLIPFLSNALPHTGFFCPNAPTPMMYNGYEWFSLSDYAGIPEMADRHYLDDLLKRAEKPAGLLSEYIEHIKTTYNLQDHNIILGGFSQGGLMALYTGLTGPHNIAGIIGCSAVPIVFENAIPTSSIKRKIPVLLTHGSADDVVPVYGVNITKDELQKANIEADICLSDGLGHGIDNTCLTTIISFISNIFKN